MHEEPPIVDAQLEKALCLLEEIVAEVRGLRTDLAARWVRPSDDMQPGGGGLKEHQRSARVGDDAFLAGLADSIGGVAFNAADLLARAVVDTQFRALLAHRPSHSARSFGHHLSALYKRAAQGRYRLDRIGRDRRGAIWSVVFATTPDDD